jgi:hypothetical protein
MRFTAIINLPVVFLALVIGAAATPLDTGRHPNNNPLVKGPSRFFLNLLRILTLLFVV